MKIKISIAQLNLELGNFQKNVDKVLYLIDSLDTYPDHLLLLPELWSTGFTPKLAEAATFNAQLLQPLRQIATKRSISIAGSFVVQCEDGNYQNRLLLINPGQTQEVGYSKIHLIESMNEKKWFTPGKELTMARLFNVEFGFAICYDLRFPELFRRLNQNGALVYLIPAQWPQKRVSQFQKLLPARAIENQAIFIATNTVGMIGRTEFGGESMVVDQFGDVVLSANKSVDVILSTMIDTDPVINWRKKFPAQSDRKLIDQYPLMKHKG